MKFTKIAALLLSLSIAGISIAACSNEPEPVSSDINVISTQAQNVQGSGADNHIDENAINENYVFIYNGVTVTVKTPLDLSKFNDDDYDYYEVPSCAGQGMATLYEFKGGSVKIETHTGSTAIARIALCDDTVATAEGVYIGQTVDDVKAAYGEPTEIAGSNYDYVKGSSRLRFLFENDKVTGITYFDNTVNIG